MFGLLKKDQINSTQRFNHIVGQLEKSIQKTIKTTTGDLRFVTGGIDNNIDSEFINSLISQILTQKIGFGILSLNIGIRKQENSRSLIYDTFDVWENNIKSNSVKISGFITKELQNEIYARYLLINRDLQFVEGPKSVLQFFETAFQNEASWYAENNSLESTEKFIRLIRNEYLTTFSLFDRYFSKYKHD